MKGLLFVVYCLLLCVLFAGTAKGQHQNKQQKANVRITFINSINQQPLVLDAGNYTNCWNEKFTISALKYYVSNISLQTTDKKMIREENSYHLINEEDTTSKTFLFFMPPNEYSALSFLIGVDSLKNVSGAQTDALDPLNSMFWTWHTGYIMFKLEGNSPQSASINNKIEYHIGGFSGDYSVLKNEVLNFPGTPFSINNNSITDIIINTNIDKLWNAANDLKITETPVCTTPGQLAAGIAANYARAFEIIRIVQ